MKKRFISKWLMAALVVVTMGVFSSCKDYDDDINANTALINQLQTQVKALEEARTSLEKQLSDANTAIKSAQDDATLALSQITQAKKDLSDAIAKGDEANAQEIQKLTSRINTLESELKQYASDQAAAAVEAAVTKYQLAEVANLITKVQLLDQAMADRYTKEEIDAKLANYVKSEDFTKAVQDINTEIGKLRDDLKANADADKVVADKLDEIYSRAIKDGEIDKAIAAVASDLSSFKEGINKIINEDEAKEKAGFATLTALNKANKQIEANETAIKELQNWKTDFTTNILPTLATVEALNQAVVDLKKLIDAKADKTALDDAVEKINKTIETLATKTEVTSQIETAVEGIKTLLKQDYVSNTALETALTKLSGEITLAYQTYTDDKLDAFKGELAGIIQTAIDANNTTLKNEIYGEVDSKISKALVNYVTNSGLDAKLANYTTTQSLMTILADYSTKDNVTAEINKFYNEKLAAKMAEIETISAQLASMDQAFVDLAEELAQLEDFAIDETSSSRKASSATSGITALKNLLATMSAKIVNIHNYVEQSIVKVNDKIDVFISFTNKNITSLVSKPDVWTYGFPTIEATIIEAQPTFTFNEGTIGGLVSEYDEDAEYVGGANNPTLSGYSFELAAKYWVNPSCVTEEFLKDNYDYWFDEIATLNYITRGNNDEKTAGFEYVKFDSYKDNILTVKFKFDEGANVNDALTKYDFDPETIDGRPGFTSYAWVTTIALQATRKNLAEENDINLDDNRIVTSDYAIVYPTYLNNLKLGNNKYAETGHFVEIEETPVEQIGNQKWHLNTAYEDAAADDSEGLYSFEIERDALETIDFNDFIDVHYNGCEGVWTNEKAQELGFTFKYTLLTNTDVWNLDGSEISVKEGADVAANTTEDKAAIVRVELIANGKTYAYGYVTVKMNNTSLDIEMETELTLNCEYEQDALQPFTASFDWNELIGKIKAGLGIANNENIDWTLCDFVPVTAEEGTTAPNAGPYKKFKNKTSDDASSRKGTIKHVGDELVWQFTESQVKSQFYNNGIALTAAEFADKYNYRDIDNVKKTGYSTFIRIVPSEKGEDQAFAQINIRVTITTVTYPSGSFNDPATETSDRITSNWFKMYSNEKTTDGTLRYEIHVNDEAPGETDANNEIKYDVTSAFVGNKFKFTGDTGFEDIPDEADLFFNQAKYFIFNGTNGTAWDKNADYILNGAHGNQYVMYLHDPEIDEGGVAPYTILYAALIDENGVAHFVAAEDTVAVLTGDNNELVTFKDYDNAKDLLNHARHDQLGKDETFTSHMIMHASGYCLPVAERGNNTFDIRYLRPISANVAGQKKVYDAKDDGNSIYVADLVSFIDWRKHEFEASNATVKVPTGQPQTNWKGYDYMRYYGITTIKADFAKARSNVHVGQLSDIQDANGNIVNPEGWPTIKEITGKINFYPDANAEAINAGGTADANTGWTADYTGFRVANGYYTYENNSGGTTDFYIILPVSVVYKWGETQPEWILIEVKGTEGQGNHARQF